ncbi:MAG: NAD(P)H-dependent oxidoreductase [Bacteroidota bacterium]
MKVAILSGSARTNNNTIRVARALKNKLDALGYTSTIIDFTAYDLPLTNQAKIDANNLTAFQLQLVNTWAESQLIITISPEYNWTTTPELLNMYNVLGTLDFRHLFDNKVFSFVGVSTGKGGKMPCLTLIQVLGKLVSFTNSYSVVSPKIFESHFTKEVLDENGMINDNEMYNKGLSDFLTYSLNTAKRWIPIS